MGGLRAGARSYRFRVELRHRRLAWVGVAVIIGVSAGLVLALLAGARRSDSAVQRFVDDADAHQDLVISGIPGTFDFAELDLEEVAQLPGVSDSEHVAVLVGAGQTSDGRSIDASTANFIVDPSGRIGRDFDRFKVLEGRLADPDEPNEVVAVFRTAEDFDLDVGDTIDLNLLDEAELGGIFSGQATFEDLSTVEPRERLEVVGIVVEAGGLAPPGQDDTTNIWMTPAAAEAYGDYGLIQIALVGLEDGADGEAAFVERLEELGGGQPVNNQSTQEDADAADRGLNPIVRALFLTALLLAIVTVLVAAQVLSRQAATESVDDPALRALGWTGRDLLRLRLAKAGVIGVGACVVAVVVAVALSPLFPLGLARKVEPHPGVSIDALVVIAGAVLVLASVTGLAGVSGWWHLRRESRGRVRRPSRTVAAISAIGATPSVSVGTSLAVQPGPVGAAPPILSVGATVGLGLGTVAAVLAFTASLGHLTESPKLYGWNWDVELGQAFSSGLTDGDVATLRDDPAVESLAVGAAANVTIEGDRVDAYAVEDVVGEISPSLLDGRRAERPDEVVVVPALGGVGDTVTFQFGGEQADLVVVGTAALPRADAMLTFEGLQELSPDVARQTALVSLRPDADEGAFLDRAFAAVGYTGQDVATPELPDDLLNFGRVDAAPAVIASAMSLVAITTLIHGLVTTVRRRRGDLAVLRALGLTRRQVLATVAWEAGLIVVAASVVAVPLGVAAGRWGWILFAGELEVISVPIVPVLGLVLAAVGALVLAELVAVLAGRWSVHRSAATALRAE